MPAQSKRRWLRFSLRTLFLLVAVASLSLLWWRYHVDWIRARHEALAFPDWVAADFSQDVARPLPGKPAPPRFPWSLRVLGESPVLAIQLDHNSFMLRADKLRSLFPEAVITQRKHP